MRYLLPAAIAFLLYLLGPAGAAPASQTRGDRRIPIRALARMMIPGTQELQLVVELTDPSVVEKIRASESSASSSTPRRISERSRPMDLASSQAITYRQQTGQARQLLKNKILELPGAQVQGETDAVMNAVIVRAPAEHYATIRRLPGVKKVYFSRPRHLLLDQAASLQNAQGLWSRAGGQNQAGRGIKIGIIDTGIDITNPMFVDSSLTPPAGFPKYDNQTDKAFTNTKVIVARNYISLLANAQRVQTAIDEVGHGTFVAGCAAGKQVTAPLATISGMAPGAFLGSYKIFGTPGTNDTTTTAAILAAVNDAVNDGMNVINLSLGFLDYVPPSEDPEVTALENAVNAGVVVTISAGNEGPSSHTINSPGAAPDAITVGSVTNGRTFHAALHATAPAPIPANLSTIGYLPSGDGPPVTSNISSTSILDVAALDGNGLGCSTLPSGSLSSKIAFVERGVCRFVDKVGNSAAAGAIAVIVYNNDPSTGPFSMGGLGPTTIPAVMISNADGVALKQFIKATPGSAQVAIDSSAVTAVPYWSVVSSFSSVGPGTDFSIKPDMVAVGENVYSAAESTSSSGPLYSSTKFMLASGTSFSAPMVAGAAAGLKQLFPSLGALAIKSLLTTTASRNLTVDGTNPPNIVKVGSGLLDMGSASAAGAVFSPTSLNFGVHSYSGSLSLAATLTIQNISASSDQFTLGVAPIVSGPTITFSQNSTGSLAPGAAASIGISLQVTAPLSGGFQGFVTIQSSSTSFAYRIPYWAGLYVPDSTRVLPVSLSASGGGSFNSLSAALAAARPGNVIEIEDSATYPAGSSGLVISTNSEGLPLHGITIRAAAGQTPVIDGSALTGTFNNPPPPDIQVVGLQNALLQGLTINSGYTGIELTQPSSIAPFSVTIDHCIVSNSTGDIGAVGIFIDGGGSVDITQSTINGSAGTGILAGAYADGTQLTILATTIQGNGNDGLDAYGSNVDILNSTVSGNFGAGLYLDYCTGTINGNTIAQSRTFTYQGQSSYGDAIDIADGNIIVKNNTFDSNDQAGVALLSGNSTRLGPVAQIVGNTMRKNGFFGLYSNPSPSALIDSNLIEDNAGGIGLTGGTSALLLNNIIVRSTDASLGNGIAVGGGSNARIVNNTVYQNTLHGVALSSGTVSIINTIVSGSGKGDLQGLSPSSVQSSLIGDESISGSGILSGDPKLSNPGADDFSLAPGSPAIDAGLNLASDLPFLDYNGRLRVASTSALAGQGTVDLGAEEANSAYPLVYPLVVNGNEPTLGGTFTTGIAVMNPTSTAAQVNFAAASGDGSVLVGRNNPTLQSLGSRAQLPILAYQLFGLDPTTPSLGSVLATSASSLAGFFLIFDPTFSHFSSGVNVSSQTGKDIVFMLHEFDLNGKATYVISNPGVNSANVTATLYSSTGQSIGQQQTATVTSRGQLVFGFNSVTLSSGYVRVQSDRPVSGLEIIGNTNFLSALGGFSPGSEGRLFFPHYAVGENFSTQIGIVNLAASAANLTLSAYDDSGNLLASTTPPPLPAGGQLLQAVTDLLGIGAGSLQTGYIVAQSDQPGIMGFTNFTYNDGTHISTAAVPADSLPRQHLLFSHVAHQVPSGSGVPYQTGIALLNPFGTALAYTISVFDGTGNLLAQASNTLGPHQKIAKILSHPVAGAGFFTQSLSLGSGHVEVLTDYGLLGFELFFTEDYSQLASVPAQIGN